MSASDHELDASEPAAPDSRLLRRMMLSAALVVIVQSAVGIVVNLYVTIPADHPGVHASNYLTASARSVSWAMGHGAAALSLHALLGLVLVALAVIVPVMAFELRLRAVGAWSVLAALLVIGAGFNGASFLDYNKDVNSLIMALLAFGAMASYTIAIFLLPAGARLSARARGDDAGPWA